MSIHFKINLRSYFMANMPKASVPYWSKFIKEHLNETHWLQPYYKN